MERKSDGRGGEIPALTMVRFAAAFGVLLFHSGRLVVPDGALRNIASSGYSGVALFFILSGFILTYVYHYRPTARLRDFYWGRFARIYPVYLLAWLMFAVCFAREMAQSSISMAYAAKAAGVYGGLSLVLLQAWIPGAAQHWNWPGWSLSVETLFYALFPLLLPVAQRLSRQSIAYCLIGALLGTVAVQGAIGATMGTMALTGTPFEAQWDDVIAHYPLLNLPLFIAGIALARLFIDGVNVRGARYWLAVTAGVIVLTLAAGDQHAHWGWLRRDMLLAPEFAALIYLLALVRGSSMGTWGKVGVLLGQSSYALYIVQTPFARLYWGHLGYAAHDTWVGFVGYAAAVVAFSVAIHLFIEKPAEREIKRVLIAPRVRTVVSGGTV